MKLPQVYTIPKQIEARTYSAEERAEVLDACEDIDYALYLFAKRVKANCEKIDKILREGGQS